MKGILVNRQIARSLAVAALVLTAGLTACANKGEKAAEPAPKASSGQEWGAGPYSQWQPITPPSQQKK